MKTTKAIYFIGFFIGLFSCNGDDTVELSNPDVDTYIELLRSNQYESSKLPEFTTKDIPKLFEYLDDNSVINRFPYNPISSYIPPSPDYRLSVLVLWTIESIRVAANNKLIAGFPSQHPFVQTRSEPVEWITNHEDPVYETVRQSYLNWWNENKHKKFITYSSIDPLENTNYRWH